MPYATQSVCHPSTRAHWKLDGAEVFNADAESIFIYNNMHMPTGVASPALIARMSQVTPSPARVLGCHSPS
jgi:hypothetical protein